MKYNLLVIRRGEYDCLDKYINNDKFLYKHKNKLEEIEIDLNELSATYVRDKIRNNDLKDLELAINSLTLKYILKNNLYKQKGAN